MSHSITTFRGLHINGHDTCMAAWLFFAAEEMRKIQPHEAWMTEVTAQWADSVHAPGCLCDALFHHFLTDDSRRDVAIRVARNVVDRFIAFGDRMPKALLESMGMPDTYWVFDPETIYFTRLARGLLNLLLEDDTKHTDAVRVERW